MGKNYDTLLREALNLSSAVNPYFILESIIPLGIK
jgi:hypothetical protein